MTPGLEGGFGSVLSPPPDTHPGTVSVIAQSSSVGTKELEDLSIIGQGGHGWPQRMQIPCTGKGGPRRPETCPWALAVGEKARGCGEHRHGKGIRGLWAEH